MKIIIVGGGRMGKQLAMDLPQSTIIENDANKIDDLISNFGEERIIEGSGTSEEMLKRAGIENSDVLVVATDSDHTNYLVAIIAERYKVPKIIVRVDNPDSIDNFKQIGIVTIICPAITAARMINSTLYPEAQEVSEIVICEDSPIKGKSVSEMDLPDKAMVVAILRGYHLIKPSDDLILEKGDHIIVCSTGGLHREVGDIISGGEERLRPFDNIMSVVNEEKDLGSVLKEAMCFATNLDIGLTVSSTSMELIDKSLAKVSKRGIQAEFKQVNSTGLGELTWILQKELPDIQCVAVRVRQEGRGHRAEAKEVLSFIKASRIPVLISKGTCPYRRIITIMGYEDRCEWSANLALKVALVTGADLHVMNYRDPEDIEQKRMLHIKRMGKMYDIDVTEDVVEGNPTLEFVSQITQGNYDLAVINWDANIIKRDVLKRMFFEAPMSILVYTT